MILSKGCKDFALVQHKAPCFSSLRTRTLTTHDYEPLFRASQNASTVAQIHGHIVADGLQQNVFLATQLTHKYYTHGRLQNARIVFEETEKKNPFLFNAIIKAYSWQEPHEEAFVLYKRMQDHGFWPDNFTFCSLLKACSAIFSLFHGKMIHLQIIKGGFDLHAFVSTGLIDMYAKCEKMDYARQVFDEMPVKDIVAFNAMVAGHALSGNYVDAVKMIWSMRSNIVSFDPSTMANLLAICGALKDAQAGCCVHGCVVKKGFGSDRFASNALIDMYAKCGCVALARQVFDEMPMHLRDVISWNSLICGYAQNDQDVEALNVFRYMVSEGLVMPNSFAIATAVSACAHMRSLDQGEIIHDYATQHGLESETPVINSLIDMYAKCGNLGIARELFENIPRKDVISWNSMIAGYGLHGHGKEAVGLFYRMRNEGLKPSQVTFIHLLCACSHAGLVDKGLGFLESMREDYQIVPALDHYACMVDLLGRAGRLNDALEFVKTMPLDPDDRIWGTLLSACKIHQNLEVAEIVGEELFNKVGTRVPGYYVLMSNMYAEGGRLDGVIKMRRMMKDKGLKKMPGISTVELNGETHEFYAEDNTHPQYEEMHKVLMVLYKQMKEMGYQPNTSFVYYEIRPQEKEDVSCNVA